MSNQLENRLYLARLYCEQARIVLSPSSRGLMHYLLEMAIQELRSEEARLKAGDSLMQARPRQRGEAEGDLLDNAMTAVTGEGTPMHMR